MSITPSHIIEYLFCPRFTWYEYVLRIPQYEEKNYKVMRGRHLHDQKLERNKSYLRKKIGVKEKYLDQYITNDLMRGKVDEVLLLHDGTMAPLDYKFAQYNDRLFNTYRTQLYCYAWLIEENFSKPVNRGFLVFTRSQNKLVEVEIPESAKEKVKQDAFHLLEIIEKNKYPRSTRSKKKCVTCTYRNICVK